MAAELQGGTNGSGNHVQMFAEDQVPIELWGKILMYIPRTEDVLALTAACR